MGYFDRPKQRTCKGDRLIWGLKSDTGNIKTIEDNTGNGQEGNNKFYAYAGDDGKCNRNIRTTDSDKVKRRRK